jgi:LysR family transcriptional regulator, benzoate and cis,cis-muconate-responsive activator of ben and cat genes
MEPEARLLRYFLAVAAELNFTRAAETLGIAQPALSAQIRQLETQLGVQLLERTTRSVQLTDAGRVVQERGPAALAGLAETWEAARRAGRGETGRLRVAYSPSAGYETAPTLVRAVRDRYPGIEVTAEVLPTPDIVRAVRDGRVDVGVARMPEPQAGVRLRTLRLEPLGALVPADHPLAAGRDVDLATIAEHPILMHPRSANPAQFDFVHALLSRSGLEPRFVERTVAFDPTQSMIRAGHAVGLAGASSADGLAADLRWIPVADPGVRMVMQLVLRDGDISPAADRFERVAVATAAAAGWLDPPAGRA